MKLKPYLKETERDRKMGPVFSKQANKKTRKKKAKKIMQIPVIFKQFMGDLVLQDSTDGFRNQHKIQNVKDWKNHVYPSQKVFESCLLAEKLKEMSAKINNGLNSRGETSKDQWQSISANNEDHSLEKWGNSSSDDNGAEYDSDSSLEGSSIQIRSSTPKCISENLLRENHDDKRSLESCQRKSNNDQIYEKMGLDEINLYDERNKEKTEGSLPTMSGSNQKILFNGNVKKDVDDSLSLGSCQATGDCKDTNEEQGVATALDQNSGPEHWDGEDSSDEETSSHTTNISFDPRDEKPAPPPGQCHSKVVSVTSEQAEHWDDSGSSADELSCESKKHPAAISDQFTSKKVFKMPEGQCQYKDGPQSRPFDLKLTSSQLEINSDFSDFNKTYVKALELPRNADGSVNVNPPELTPKTTSLRKQTLGLNVDASVLAGNEFENSLSSDLSKISLTSRPISGSEQSKPSAQSADFFDRYSEDGSKDIGNEPSAPATDSTNLHVETIPISTHSLDHKRKPLFPIDNNSAADSSQPLLALSLQQSQMKIKSQNLDSQKLLLAAVGQYSGGGSTPASHSPSVAEAAALKEDQEDRVEKVLSKLTMQRAQLRFRTRNRFPAPISSAKKVDPIVMPSNQYQESEQAQVSSAALPRNKELSDEELRKFLMKVEVVSSADNKIMKSKPFPCPLLSSKKSKVCSSSSSKEEKNVNKWCLQEHGVKTQSLEHPSQLLEVPKLRERVGVQDFPIPRTTSQCLLQTGPFKDKFSNTQNSQYASAGRIGAAENASKSSQQRSPMTDIVKKKNWPQPLLTPMNKLNKTPQSSLQMDGAPDSWNLKNSLKRPTNPSALVRSALSDLRTDSNRIHRTDLSSKVAGDSHVIQKLLTAEPVSLMLKGLKTFPKNRSTNH